MGGIMEFLADVGDKNFGILFFYGMG